MACTPQIITLFSKLKHGANSSPVLTRFYSYKPTLLKEDWSSEGLGSVLIQPATDK